MILRRYLARQLLTACFAVALVLAVILVSGRVIKYFGQAADGRMEVGLLMAVLVYRLPAFFELIIPLGLFTGVLLAFGRMYMDNEMAVIQAAGIGRGRLIRQLTAPVLLVMLMVAGISLYVTPTGNYAAEALFQEQAQRNTFDLVTPQTFRLSEGGQHMLYTEAISPDRTELRGVVMYEQRQQKEAALDVLLTAASGRRVTDKQGVTYLELFRGQRTELQPGSAASRVVQFERYRLKLSEPSAPVEVTKVRALSTPVLWRQQRTPLMEGEWLWRWSMPLLVPVVALLALPLARVNPRQGRYFTLLPAILLFLSYVVLIAAARNGVEKGRLTSTAAWGVHGFYLVLALVMLNMERLRLRWRRWRRAGA